MSKKTYQIQDPYFKKAQAAGFRARSVFKLQEIQERFHFIRPGDRVLDLGAAPGSFMQYILPLVGQKGLVVGIDLQQIRPFKQKNAHIFVADIFDEKSIVPILEQYGPFDIITSDLAPSTSGIAFVDAGRSLALNQQVLSIAQKSLKKGGHLVLKALKQDGVGELKKQLDALFKKTTFQRPKAVRGSSQEGYLIGNNFSF